MSPRHATKSGSTTRSAPRAASERTRRKEVSLSRPKNVRPVAEPPIHESAGDDLPDDANVPAIGENLRQLRLERSLSLDAFSQMCGVSRAMLGQIELNRSVPTITVLWRIARALDVPFSSLMREPAAQGPSVLRRKAARYLTSADGTFRSRALFPADRQRFVEFYEVRLAPGATEEASPHAAGTLENVVVASGSLEVTAGGEPTQLGTGDAIVFRADVPHRYHNPGSVEAITYMVITYAQRG